MSDIAYTPWGLIPIFLGLLISEMELDPLAESLFQTRDTHIIMTHGIWAISITIISPKNL